MARNYYSLVAGLKEYTLESDKKGFDAKAIIEEVRGELRGNDIRSLEMFYAFYDIGNLINIIRGREQFSALGNFTREELEEGIKTPETLPAYIAEALSVYESTDEPEGGDKTAVLEKALFETYYEQCVRSSNKFLKRWYEFDRNLRNVSAAFMARREKMPVAGVLIGEGYVTDMLSKSSAADFGLKGEIDYMDELIEAVGQEGNLLDKEHKIDMIRWRMANELSVFDYFNLNTILAYLAKINIVERWMALDREKGREIFRRLVDSFSGKEMIERAEKEYVK